MRASAREALGWVFTLTSSHVDFSSFLLLSGVLQNAKQHHQGGVCEARTAEDAQAVAHVATCICSLSCLYVLSGVE